MTPPFVLPQSSARPTPPIFSNDYACPTPSSRRRSMLGQQSFDYAIIRIVPRVERGEFVNTGVILFSRTGRYLEARIELDHRRLAALAPDIDIAEVERQLAVIPLICGGDPVGGPIAALPASQRFHWLTAPRSTVIQTSPVHVGLCQEPERMLEHLMETMVRSPLPPDPTMGAGG